MDDEDDDARRLPSYHHHNTHQLHQIYAQELQQVAAAATAEQKQQQEGAEDEEDDDEEEGDEGEEGEEDEEEEAEDMEEDAIEDDEDDEGADENEDDDEDDHDDDEEAREQEHHNNEHNYEQNFELEQRHKIVGEGLNLTNGLASLAAAGLINPVIAPPQQQLAVIGELLPQQVGIVDVKPSIRDDWTEAATHALLEAWGQRYVELNKGNLKQEDWEEVALKVSSMSKTHKTDVQCKNRLDTLKKKYKVEKQKQSAIGSTDSKWPFYKKLDQLLCATTKQTGIPGAVDAGHPVKSSALLDSFRGEQLKGVRKFEAEEEEEEEILPNNASTCSKSKESPGMTFSSPQPQNADGTTSSTRKRKAMETPFKTLAKAITRFGEIYEKMEQSKQQQLMDLEKIRMEFTRDLEMQRMQLFMQTQVELAKMKHGGNDVDATISNLSG